MLKTVIIQDLEDGAPIWLPYEGLAANLTIAKWMFSLCGWQQDIAEPAQLLHMIEEKNWPEGDEFYSYDLRELYVLGQCLYMN